MTGTYHLIDIQRVQASPARVEQLLRDTAERDGRAVRIYIEQEPGAAGKIVGHHYRRLLDGHTVHIEPVTGSKITRAQPFAARAEQGDIKMVTAPWNDAFLDEAEVFPDGAHDDQIDAVAGALAALAEHPRHNYNFTIPIIEREEPSLYGFASFDGYEPTAGG